MKQGYIFEYENENDYRKKERSVRKYNMLAFKKLQFDYYKQLREGNFIGKLVNEETLEDGSKMHSYELILPSDDKFVKVHGEIILHYTTYDNKNIILLTNISSKDGILEEGHRSELTAYNGVLISQEHKEKDMFKINLLNMLQK